MVTHCDAVAYRQGGVTSAASHWPTIRDLEFHYPFMSGSDRLLNLSLLERLGTAFFGFTGVLRLFSPIILRGWINDTYSVEASLKPKVKQKRSWPVFLGLGLRWRKFYVSYYFLFFYLLSLISLLIFSFSSPSFKFSILFEPGCFGKGSRG